ncbi:DUF5304 domain-containing protein [Streptomyces samsunensis]|nr:MULTISPECIES: DUF5304 family protein [Streptomyces]MYU15683.1 hypothetical protein [Streptomyces sp. SID8361]AQA11395.1 hypothetical protein BV401_13780 [Streptomyces autolyticus]ATL82295.1 hypothetical protein SMALA_2061 [Streptomyces malaysiensis]AUA14397.1 hypothetical protein CFP59_06575 [Streptomyces sp. M56]MCC4321723.1 DUF5304 domain-containing protein [Streptomyces malaysiensis]
MSDATERPPEPPVTEVPVTEIDPDAWERACAEDLAAERARRRARQAAEEPGSVAEEFLKLADALADKVAQAPIAGAAVQGAVQQLIEQAKAAVEPVIERNPDVFEHLASAGTELLAAYRAAVTGQERRWTQGSESGTKGGGEESESSSSEHIDLD